jgi:hypothetical protein
MAKKPRFDPTSFNFGASKRAKKGTGKKGGGRKSNVWRGYVGGGRGSAPLPD